MVAGETRANSSHFVVVYKMGATEQTPDSR